MSRTTRNTRYRIHSMHVKVYLYTLLLWVASHDPPIQLSKSAVHSFTFQVPFVIRTNHHHRLSAQQDAHFTVANHVHDPKASPFQGFSHPNNNPPTGGESQPGRPNFGSSNSNNNGGPGRPNFGDYYQSQHHTSTQSSESTSSPQGGSNSSPWTKTSQSPQSPSHLQSETSNPSHAAQIDILQGYEYGRELSQLQSVNSNPNTLWKFSNHGTVGQDGGSAGSEKILSGKGTTQEGFEVKRPVNEDDYMKNFGVYTARQNGSFGQCWTDGRYNPSGYKVALGTILGSGSSSSATGRNTNTIDAYQIHPAQNQPSQYLISKACLMIRLGRESSSYNIYKLVEPQIPNISASYESVQTNLSPSGNDEFVMTDIDVSSLQEPTVFFALPSSIDPSSWQQPQQSDYQKQANPVDKSSIPSPTATTITSGRSSPEPKATVTSSNSGNNYEDQFKKYQEQLQQKTQKKEEDFQSQPTKPAIESSGSEKVSTPPQPAVSSGGSSYDSHFNQYQEQLRQHHKPKEEQKPTSIPAPTTTTVPVATATTAASTSAESTSSTPTSIQPSTSVVGFSTTSSYNIQTGQPNPYTSTPESKKKLSSITPTKQTLQSMHNRAPGEVAKSKNPLQAALEGQTQEHNHVRQIREEQVRTYTQDNFPASISSGERHSGQLGESIPRGSKQVGYGVGANTSPDGVSPNAAISSGTRMPSGPNVPPPGSSMNGLTPPQPVEFESMMGPSPISSSGPSQMSPMDRMSTTPTPPNAGLGGGVGYVSPNQNPHSGLAQGNPNPMGTTTTNPSSTSTGGGTDGTSYGGYGVNQNTPTMNSYADQQTSSHAPVANGGNMNSVGTGQNNPNPGVNNYGNNGNANMYGSPNQNSSGNGSNMNDAGVGNIDGRGLSSSVGSNGGSSGIAKQEYQQVSNGSSSLPTYPTSSRKAVKDIPEDWYKQSPPIGQKQPIQQQQQQQYNSMGGGRTSPPQSESLMGPGAMSPPGTQQDSAMGLGTMSPLGESAASSQSHQQEDWYAARVAKEEVKQTQEQIRSHFSMDPGTISPPPELVSQNDTPEDWEAKIQGKLKGPASMSHSMPGVPPPISPNQQGNIQGEMKGPTRSMSNLSGIGNIQGEIKGPGSIPTRSEIPPPIGGNVQGRMRGRPSTSSGSMWETNAKEYDDDWFQERAEKKREKTKKEIKGPKVPSRGGYDKASPENDWYNPPGQEKTANNNVASNVPPPGLNTKQWMAARIERMAKLKGHSTIQDLSEGRVEVIPGFGKMDEDQTKMHVDTLNTSNEIIQGEEMSIEDIDPELLRQIDEANKRRREKKQQQRPVISQIDKHKIGARDPISGSSGDLPNSKNMVKDKPDRSALKPDESENSTKAEVKTSKKSKELSSQTGNMLSGNQKDIDNEEWLRARAMEGAGTPPSAVIIPGNGDMSEEDIDTPIASSSENEQEILEDKTMTEKAKEKAEIAVRMAKLQEEAVDEAKATARLAKVEATAAEANAKAVREKAKKDEEEALTEAKKIAAEQNAKEEAEILAAQERAEAAAKKAKAAQDKSAAQRAKVESEALEAMKKAKMLLEKAKKAAEIAAGQALAKTIAQRELEELEAAAAVAKAEAEASAMVTFSKAKAIARRAKEKADADSIALKIKLKTEAVNLLAESEASAIKLKEETEAAAADARVEARAKAMVTFAKSKAAIQKVKEEAESLAAEIRKDAEAKILAVYEKALEEAQEQKDIAESEANEQRMNKEKKAAEDESKSRAAALKAKEAAEASATEAKAKADAKANAAFIRAKISAQKAKEEADAEALAQKISKESEAAETEAQARAKAQKARKETEAAIAKAKAKAEFQARASAAFIQAKVAAKRANDELEAVRRREKES